MKMMTSLGTTQQLINKRLLPKNFWGGWLSLHEAGSLMCKGHREYYL